MNAYAAVVPVVHNNSDSSSVPGEFVFAYIGVALLVWVAVALTFARREAAHTAAPQLDSNTLIDAVLLGAAAATMWPISLAGGGVWLLVRRLTRPKRPRYPQCESIDDDHTF
ncbi:MULTISPECIES: hypothetical protein [unclassified Streptomyces]|uniref:hypothetical protein n=1 Tax=unclassified Streptomyces TaxID=2593676 RepID=UPI0036681AB4